MWLGLRGRVGGTVRVGERCSELGVRTGELVVESGSLGQVLFVNLSDPVLDCKHFSSCPPAFPCAFFKHGGKIKGKERVKWKPHVPEYWSTPPPPSVPSKTSYSLPYSNVDYGVVSQLVL